MDAHGLGKDEAIDLLAVGFSATDSIGHTYGPDSQEVMDQILRLDRMLARLLEEVDRRAGPGRTLVALSADHGSLPLVETLRARGLEARRVAPKVVDDAIRSALAQRFPDGASLVAAYDTPNVYLDLAEIAKRRLRRADVESAVAAALMGTGLVKAVYTQDQLAAPAADKYQELFRNSFFQPRSPHVMALLSENIYLASYAGGTGHGTAHEYDRHVPVVFMGPGVKPGLYAAPVGPHHIAATLGALIGVDYPLQDADRLLTEAIAPAAPASGGAR
jgi:predicted AlkP superfamily pyrophosphatase or phosphodiesterase